MGFFDLLLGQGFRNPPEERWEEIVGTIHHRLGEERQTFFDGCLGILHKFPDATIKNKTMSPRIELGMTLYQIYLGRQLIASKRYISTEFQNSFASLLYEHACRSSSLTERSELIHRYLPHQDNSGGEIFILYSDIVKFITAPETPSPETIANSSYTTNRFTKLSLAAFAGTFGDRKTVRDLNKTLSNIHRG